MEIKFIILFVIIFIGFIANICTLIKNIYDSNPWKVLFRLFICTFHLGAMVIICVKVTTNEEKPISQKETVIIIKVDSNNLSDTLKIDTLNTTDLQILVNK